MTEDTEGQEPKRFFRIRTSIVESMTKAGMAEEEESQKKKQQTTDSTVTNLLQLEPLKGGEIRRIW